MNTHKLMLLFLGIFLLLFGVAHVTNIQVVWMNPIMGIAALVAGVLALFEVLKS